MSFRIVKIKCLAADPVPCTEMFMGASEGAIARQMLEHLDTVHVHDDGGPSWGLSWRDASGEQHIGVVHDGPEERPAQEPSESLAKAWDEGRRDALLDARTQDYPLFGDRANPYRANPVAEVEK